MLDIDAGFVASRLPRPLSEPEKDRVAVLIDDAVEVIDMAFAKVGRSFALELESVPWLESAARRAVLEMVSASVLVGGHTGVRSVSSTTGPQSDSITFADVGSVSWGGVRLTSDLLRLLGLAGQYPRGCFPPARRWPERRA